LRKGGRKNKYRGTGVEIDKQREKEMEWDK